MWSRPIALSGDTLPLGHWSEQGLQTVTHVEHYVATCSLLYLWSQQVEKSSSISFGGLRCHVIKCRETQKKVMLEDVKRYLMNTHLSSCHQLMRQYDSLCLVSLVYSQIAVMKSGASARHMSVQQYGKSSMVWWGVVMSACGSNILGRSLFRWQHWRGGEYCSQSGNFYFNNCCGIYFYFC